MKSYSAAAYVAAPGHCSALRSVRFASRAGAPVRRDAVLCFRNLAIFIVCGRIGFHEGIAFFVVGVDVMVISQLWHFNHPHQTAGRAVIPLAWIAAAPSAHGQARVTAKSLIRQPVLMAYGRRRILLIACAALTVAIHHRHIPDKDPKAREIAEQPLSKEGGFELIFRDRYLLLMAALAVLSNVVNTAIC